MKPTDIDMVWKFWASDIGSKSSIPRTWVCITYIGDDYYGCLGKGWILQ